jgi:CspA family cold shock protein
MATQRGVVKKLADRGFGFLKAEGSEQEFFFHRSAVVNDGFDHLTEGQKVTFVEEPSPKGPRAASVAPTA